MSEDLPNDMVGDNEAPLEWVVYVRQVDRLSKSEELDLYKPHKALRRRNENHPVLGEIAIFYIGIQSTGTDCGEDRAVCDTRLQRIIAKKIADCEPDRQSAARELDAFKTQLRLEKAAAAALEWLENDAGTPQWRERINVAREEARKTAERLSELSCSKGWRLRRAQRPELESLEERKRATYGGRCIRSWVPEEIISEIREAWQAEAKSACLDEEAVEFCWNQIRAKI